MAYDIARRKTTPRNWSRGSAGNVGTVGAAPLGGEGMKKKLIVGALVGAAAAAGYLTWRGRHRPARRHPMSYRVMYERGPGGQLIRRI